MGGRAIIGKNFCYFCALKNAQFFIFCLLFFPFSTQNSAVDTITPNQNFTDGKTLVSARKVFELGFFSPDKGSPNKRYLGIWYYGIRPQTVVWVANRKNPVPDYHGVFALRNNGELQVMDGKGIILWSSANSSSTAKSLSVLPDNATLMDNGNLVLQRGKDILWQSFLEESNTFLPGMNMKTEKLRSWTNNSDPAPGDFSFSFDQNLSHFIIQNDSDTYWMSGWSSKYVSFKDVPDNLFSMMIPADNNNSYETVPAPNDKKRLVMNLSGHIEFFRWMDGTNHWSLNWTKPSDVCSVYQVCGDYGVCSVGKNVKPNCTCLPGFKPKLKTQAGSTDYSRGCQRNIENCSSKADFLPVQLDKVSYPPLRFDALREEDCIKGCKKECCNAYLFETSTARAVEKNKPSTCWLWGSNDELKDLKSSDSFGGMIKVRFVPGTATSGMPCNIIQLSLVSLIAIVFTWELSSLSFLAVKSS
ncbi:hypothetical protein SLA2020_234190, partial [Shorea laevis]